MSLAELRMQSTTELTLRGASDRWYDYFTCEYWATLFNDFLNDKKVEAPSAARKAKL